jgi:glycosyltransferase involved in cell wall biosynthesis
MNILRIYQKIPPNPGGMEQHIYQLTKEQVDNGCDVTLAFNSGSKLSEHDIVVSKFFSLSSIKPQSLSNFIFYTILIFKLLVNRKKFDVVHIHGDWSSFIFSRIIKKIVDANIVLGSFHGKLNIARLKLILYSFNKLDGLYTTGLDEYEYLTGRLGIPIMWCHSGVDSKFYQDEVDLGIDLGIDLDRDFVLSVGNCVPVKNIQLIIEVATNMPSVQFIHIGGGSLLSSYLEKTKDLKNLKFLGSKNKSTVVQAMGKAKVFLLTSYSEGTPTVILEALVKNCFIVSSNSCNLSSILNKESGVVIDGFDMKNYTSALKIYLKKETLKESKYDHFSWKAVSNVITRFTNEIQVHYRDK